MLWSPPSPLTLAVRSSCGNSSSAPWNGPLSEASKLPPSSPSADAASERSSTPLFTVSSLEKVSSHLLRILVTSASASAAGDQARAEKRNGGKRQQSGPDQVWSSVACDSGQRRSLATTPPRLAVRAD